MMPRRLDVAALWSGLGRDQIDVLATDHAPHTADEQACTDVWEAPGGFIGVETMLPLMLTEVARGRLSLERLVRMSAWRPAQIWGIADRKGDLGVGADADFNLVDRLSQKVLDRVRKATRIRATTTAGTNITAEMNPGYRWFKTSGIISPEKWGNLPGGECFTAPGEVNGTFVVDGVVGDWLCARYGLLAATPLTIEIAANRILRCASRNKELEADFWAYTHTDENSDRVGEFAIGTNIGVERVIGNILQDEKFPGIHIAFGNPYGEHTGAPWRSGTHIDVVGLGFNIWLETEAGQEQIMREGRFLIAA